MTALRTDQEITRKRKHPSALHTLRTTDEMKARGENRTACEDGGDEDEGEDVEEDRRWRAASLFVSISSSVAEACCSGEEVGITPYRFSPCATN